MSLSFAERIKITKAWYGWPDIQGLYRTQIEIDSSILLSYFRTLTQENLLYAELPYLNQKCFGRKRFMDALLDMIKDDYDSNEVLLHIGKPVGACLSRKRQFTGNNKYRQISRKVCLLIPSITYIWSVENDIASGYRHTIFAKCDESSNIL